MTIVPMSSLGYDNAESAGNPVPPLRSDKAFAIGYRIVS